jgi:hypothetical protein
LTTDLEKRRAIEQHWAASEAGDVELEHHLYAEDAILDYPQSGERFVGRSTIAEQRSGNPAHRHFRLRRVLGAGGAGATRPAARPRKLTSLASRGLVTTSRASARRDPRSARRARTRRARRLLDLLLHQLAPHPSPISHATERQTERLLADGATAYITKPIDIAQFLRTIDELLAAADPAPAPTVTK